MRPLESHLQVTGLWWAAGGILGTLLSGVAPTITKTIALGVPAGPPGPRGTSWPPPPDAHHVHRGQGQLRQCLRRAGPGHLGLSSPHDQGRKVEGLECRLEEPDERLSGRPALWFSNLPGAHNQALRDWIVLRVTGGTPLPNLGLCPHWARPARCQGVSPTPRAGLGPKR